MWKGKQGFLLILPVLLTSLFLSGCSMSGNRLVVYRFEPKPDSAEEFLGEDFSSLPPSQLEELTSCHPGTYGYERELREIAE